MQIDVTEFIRAEFVSARYYTANVSESGPTTAADTWAHCMERATDWGALVLPTTGHLEAAVAYITGDGSWGTLMDGDTVMTVPAETRALILQFVMADLRNAGWSSAYPDNAEWARVREQQELGAVGSLLYCVPAESGAPLWYVSLDF